MSPSLQPLPYQAMHVEANVLHHEGPVYTKARGASSKSRCTRFTRTKSIVVVGGKHNGTSVNMIQKRKMPSTTKTKIDGATFKIPANPEDEEDFIPDGSCVADTQKEYGLRERIGRSGSKKVCFQNVTASAAWLLSVMCVVRTESTIEDAGHGSSPFDKVPEALGA